MKKSPKINYETHTLRFPYANVIFGRVFEMPCTVVFEHSESEDQFRINIKSLVGTGEDGTIYDLMYLTEEEESQYAEFIIACIVNNKQKWDLELGEKEWWE